MENILGYRLIAIAMGDVPWMNRKVSFVAGLSLKCLYTAGTVVVRF